MASVFTDSGTPAAEAAVVLSSIPPLENGDRLDADEFLRRYGAMPDFVQAELVEGVVYLFMSISPDHGESHFSLNGLLFVYAASTPGTKGRYNTTLRLDLKNVPQPDCYIRILSEAGGQASVDGESVVGAPEFVAEVAVSSASYDLGDKLEAYRRNGVQEYAVWRLWDKAVDWFSLREGRFERMPADEDDVYRSQVLARAMARRRGGGGGRPGESPERSPAGPSGRSPPAVCRESTEETRFAANQVRKQASGGNRARDRNL